MPIFIKVTKEDLKITCTNTTTQVGSCYTVSAVVSSVSSSVFVRVVLSVVAIKCILISFVLHIFYCQVAHASFELRAGLETALNFITLKFF